MLLAQITALSIGESNEELKYKSVEGNNPISLIQLNDLSSRSLGYLLASYENKVFVESRIYDINSFDQWGVQLGKKLTLQSKKNKDYFNDYFYKEFL
jgi:glucose-6-phosphate isomerase